MVLPDPIYDPPPSELDFRWLVEQSLAGIYLVQDHRFLYVNPTFAELFGYHPDEIVGNLEVQDLVAPEDREKVLENVRRRISGQVETMHYTFRGIRRDGSMLDVEVRGRRTDTSDGPAVIGTLLDISERTQERERLTFLARAAKLLDSSLDYEVTLKRLTRLMIPSFADICYIDVLRDEESRRIGSVANRESGRKVLNLHPPPHCTDEAPSPANVLRTGKGVLLREVPPEVRQRFLGRLPEDTDADDLRIRSVIMVPLSARETVFGVMTLASSRRTYGEKDFQFAHEVARGAALSIDNARLYQEAQEAIRRREEVLAIVSHDLRNPLNVILMGTALGLEQERRARGPLEIVHGAARQMERLICDLLDLSAIEAGGFSVKLTRQQIGPTIANCLTMLEPTAAERKVRLENQIRGAATEVMLDEARISQAVSNLVGNAVKFTPPGGTVRVCVENGGDSVNIAVSDEGPGIPEDQLPRVFERFWRGEASNDGGAGLGLAIVQGIVEAHGGRVRAESPPGRGATFHLELPIAS
jgi:PAS domain S-box-containing protein